MIEQEPVFCAAGKVAAEVAEAVRVKASRRAVLPMCQKEEGNPPKGSTGIPPGTTGKLPEARRKTARDPPEDPAYAQK